MIYTTSDMQFEQLTHEGFERLCFELLLKLGYRQLLWRQGGADDGRDIQGIFPTETPLAREESRWFFECKHYTGGVPPEHLNSKIAWADAEQPAYLVFMVSSYLTNNARNWLERIRLQKRYHLLVIEGPELKNLLISFPDLIEQHFATDRYVRLLLDTKRHYQTYHLIPTYDALVLLVNNLHPEQLTLNDLGFLFISLYMNFHYDYDTEDHYGGYNPTFISKLYPRLQALATTGVISLFSSYKDNYDLLNGNGFWDKLESYIPGLEGDSDVAFQYNTLHLNYRDETKSWAMGHYLFFRTTDGTAFEIFCIQNSEFTTGVRFYPQVSRAIIDELCLTPSPEFRGVLQKHARVFSETTNERLT